MGLTLSVLSGRFAICRLDRDGAVPASVLGSGFFSVTRTADELSIVCEERCAPEQGRIERGFRMLKLHGPFELTEVGILLQIAEALAAAQVSILALSTFDTDYVLVKEPSLPAARLALRRAGHRVTEASRATLRS